jgi:hypothetical protein
MLLPPMQYSIDLYIYTNSEGEEVMAIIYAVISLEDHGGEEERRSHRPGLIG